MTFERALRKKAKPRAKKQTNRWRSHLHRASNHLTIHPSSYVHTASKGQAIVSHAKGGGGARDQGTSLGTKGDHGCCD